MEGEKVALAHTRATVKEISPATVTAMALRSKCQGRRAKALAPSEAAGRPLGRRTEW